MTVTGMFIKGHRIMIVCDVLRAFTLKCTINLMD
jgi:hypothetical protein